MTATAEYPLAAYLDRRLTKTQQRYLEWLQEKTGYEFTDLQGFMLAVALRDQFQKSPENKAFIASRKEELEAARRAVEQLNKERSAREQKAAARTAARQARAQMKAAGPAEESEMQEITAPAPELRRRRAPVTVPAPASPAEHDVDDADDDDLFADEPPAGFTAAFSDGSPRRREPAPAPF